MGSCYWLVDVFCAKQKGKKSKVIHECWTCTHHFRFLRESEKEDEEAMTDIDRCREAWERDKALESQRGVLDEVEKKYLEKVRKNEDSGSSSLK